MALEHRYYGDSQPFTDEQGGWSTENLKWLSAPQGLADIAGFIDAQNSLMKGKHQWVVIGGSYPGALVAWFKSQYPTHATAAWSSSGVIDAIQDFSQFDYTVFETIINDGVLGVICADAINNTWNDIDYIINYGTKDQIA